MKEKARYSVHVDTKVYHVWIITSHVRERSVSQTRRVYFSVFQYSVEQRA